MVGAQRLARRVPRARITTGPATSTLGLERAVDPLFTIALSVPVRVSVPRQTPLAAERKEHDADGQVPVAQEHDEKHKRRQREPAELLRPDPPSDEPSVDDKHHAQNRAAQQKHRLAERRAHARELFARRARAQFGERRYRQLREHLDATPRH